jgi:hypothetical protein
MSKQTRLDLIHAFTDELVYIRTSFPMGKKGLTLKDGLVTPNGEELQHMIAMWGPSVKAGDRAQLSNISVKDNMIHFEVNGGPVKRQKWYQRIQVGGGPNTVPVAPSDSSANPRGTYVDLVFDHYVPEMTPQELKTLLRPVFDFDSKSALEAYLDTVPPNVKAAIQNHQVLVGMDHEMVLYSKGRPPRKVREKEGDIEHEDWIYGDPPQDVDFIRFIGEEVVRVETMKVDGTKIVRTDKEVFPAPKPTVAKASERPANAPTLRRPGEVDVDSPMPDSNKQAAPGTIPPMPSPDPGGNPNPYGGTFLAWR